MEQVTARQVLDLELGANDANATTVRGYLVALLAEVWHHGDDFSGKRPFGYSSWEYELYQPLVRAGYVTGTFDEYGDLDTFDDAAADGLVLQAIAALGAPEVDATAVEEGADR